MRHLRTVRRALRLVCFAVALGAPGVASAELPAPVDVDGDGRSDTVTFDRVEPSAVRLWLSRTRTSATPEALRGFQSTDAIGLWAASGSRALSSPLRIVSPALPPAPCLASSFARPPPTPLT